MSVNIDAGGPWEVSSSAALPWPSLGAVAEPSLMMACAGHVGATLPLTAAFEILQEQ
jgi:hypothetical protein